MYGHSIALFHDGLRWMRARVHKALRAGHRGREASGRLAQGQLASVGATLHLFSATRDNAPTPRGVLTAAAAAAENCIYAVSRVRS